MEGIREDISIKRVTKHQGNVAGYRDCRAERRRVRPSDRLQVELEPRLILELMLRREICAADLRCLNRQSKLALKSLCLDACTYRDVRLDPKKNV